MSIINLLDDKTIDKIAAGEVIERPASVVKELVENSIDSGAKSISVEIKEGGISYIRVTDNGSGIEHSQIKKAFLRHATSKINDVMDLFRISSLGFRGEALSSISAIASVEVLTKTSDDFAGTRYVIIGGREEVFEEAGVPDGTTIIVRNIFYNTPARKKFLKSPNTEAGYITDLIERLVLSHPEISFKYMINGLDRIVSSGRNNLKETVYSVYGRDAVSGLIPIEYSNEYFHAEGFIGKPETARSNRNFELFFVNNRSIKCKVLTVSVEEAYKHRLMLHKYPFVILYFTIDPARLDINVHPAKTEIKLLDESPISSYLIGEIDKTLSEIENIPKVTAGQEKESFPYVYKAEPAVSLPVQKEEKVFASAQNLSVPVAEPAPVTGPARDYEEKSYKTAPEPFEIKRREAFDKTQADFPEIHDAKQLDMFEDNFLSSESIKKHRIIGQIFDTYWLVEFNSSLYIIDQHAAHEKVLYERFYKRFKNSTLESQMISPPEVLSLSGREEAALKKYGDRLTHLGFMWEHFGGNEYTLSGVPVDLYTLTERDYFISVLDDLAEGRNTEPDAVNDRIATMACKAAVKANMNLSIPEAQALIDELLKLDNPYNCPHGRPCIISYSKSELEKLFKRIV